MRVLIDWNDFEVLIAHWRNEEVQTSVDDTEYEAYCRQKAARFERLFRRYKRKTGDREYE